MKVQVLLFARYSEIAGSSRLEVEVTGEATLGAVWRAVEDRVPALRGAATPMMALDRAYAGPAQPIGEASEVAFFPPVSGG